MPAEYRKVPDDVVAMAQELIGLYHEHLLDAKIGIIFRAEAPYSNGRATQGKARKVTPEQKVYIDLDFVIWLAHDHWMVMEEDERKALLDHELCHCGVDEHGAFGIVPHDIEEFNAVLSRWGFWWRGAFATERALQGSLGIEERTGAVRALESLPDHLGDKLERIQRTLDMADRAGVEAEDLRQIIEAMKGVERFESHGPNGKHFVAEIDPNTGLPLSVTNDN